MDGKIKAALVTLGLVESGAVEKVPKMKYIKKKYYKLALLHHPDKPGGNGDLFKEISAAYYFLGNYLEEQGINEVDDNEFDFEEYVARKTFHQFQFSKIKENMRSFTIHIQNNHSTTWEKVLTKHYGNPVNKDGNGLHWKVGNYTDGNTTANISISKWHIPKKDNQSKLLIQSNESGNFLPAHYVDHVLPKLFEEVHACQEVPLRQETLPSTKKKSKPKLSGFKCKECDFDGKNITGLNKHKTQAHKADLCIPPPYQSIDKDNQDCSVKVASSEENNEIKKSGASTEIESSKNKCEVGKTKDEEESKDTPKTIEETLGELSSPEVEIAESNLNVKTYIQASNSEETGEEVNKKKEEMANINPDLKGDKSKKTVLKIRSSCFICKYCEQKFAKTTQLTSHLKTCHTKNIDVVTGNAITVNSPLVSVKHFFCHCSICGDGYDDYDQLSSHERANHNFKCNECEECYMTQSDLKSHETSRHMKSILCCSCEKTFSCADSLERHKHTVHNNNVNAVSCQTETYQCDTCDESTRKIQYMELLEKEHKVLKEEHTQVKALFFQQSQQITVINQKNESNEEEINRLKIENEKMKAESDKL